MADDLVKQVKALDAMDLAGLKAKYVEVYGVEPISRNATALREQLKRKLHRMDIDARKGERAKGGKATTETPTPDSASTTTDRLTALTGMSLAQLREEHEKVFGTPSQSRNRKGLLKKIADVLQNTAYQERMAGGSKPTLTVTAKFERKKKTRSKRITKPAEPKGDRKRTQHREPGQRDNRLPKAGTELVREWHGKKYVVRVLESGFEYNSKPFRSLSAVANHITGQIVNGYTWFKLTGEKKKS